MTEQRMRRRGPISLWLESRRIRRLVGLFVVGGGILYPLSIGPAYYIGVRSSAPLSAIHHIGTFYFPLGVLAEWFPSFGKLLRWYVGLWFAG